MRSVPICPDSVLGPSCAPVLLRSCSTLALLFPRVRAFCFTPALRTHGARDYTTTPAEHFRVEQNLESGETLVRLNGIGDGGEPQDLEGPKYT